MDNETKITKTKEAGEKFKLGGMEIEAGAEYQVKVSEEMKKKFKENPELEKMYTKGLWDGQEVGYQRGLEEREND